MISIAMATYNGEKYLREQIDSILSQTIQNFELIVCDDCSTDTTWNILLDYQVQDKRIKCYRNEKNLGFKKNFEKEIRLCTGEYIALSDQDDIWTEDHLQVLYEGIGENDLVGANAYICDKEAIPLGIDFLSCFKIDFLPQTYDDWFFFMMFSNIFQGATCLIKKSLVQKAFPIPESIELHDHWLALVAVANKGVTYVNKCILYWRRHDNNTTTFFSSNLLSKIKKAFEGTELKRVVRQQKYHIILLFRFIQSQKQIEQMIQFYIFFTNSKTIKNFLSIPFFCKNYSRLYLSKKKSLFLLRFSKFLIGL